MRCWVWEHSYLPWLKVCEAHSCGRHTHPVFLAPFKACVYSPSWHQDPNVYLAVSISPSKSCVTVQNVISHPNVNARIPHQGKAVWVSPKWPWKVSIYKLNKCTIIISQIISLVNAKLDFVTDHTVHFQGKLMLIMSKRLIWKRKKERMLTYSLFMRNHPQKDHDYLESLGLVHYFLEKAR